MLTPILPAADRGSAASMGSFHSMRGRCSFRLSESGSVDGCDLRSQS